MKNKNQLIIRNISIILALFLICGGIFYTTYKYFTNKSYSKYEKNITTQIDNIYEINSRVATYVTDETISNERILSDLQNDIDELRGIYNNISSTKPIEDDIQSYENLKNGLSNNISMYKEIFYIVKNPSSSNINNSMLNMNNYRDDCMNYYSLITFDNDKFLLPDNILHLVSGTTIYVSNVSKASTANESVYSQKKDFENQINTISATFDPIKRDCMKYVLNARNGIQTYDSILSIANKNIEEIAALEKSLEELSMPIDGIDAYEALLASLKSYHTYLFNFSYAVSTEKITIENNADISTNTLDSLYDDSNSQYSNADVTYSGFLSKFIQYKNTVK
ncbi:hypothetical protein [Clostridium sp. DL1XJH146]